MDRRAFIRLVGGGVIVAVLPLPSGCSSDIPSAAIEAWQGPKNEADVRMWILGYAILAPHLIAWRGRLDSCWKPSSRLSSEASA